MSESTTDPRAEWAEIVLGHLTDIFAGRCTLTRDYIQNLGDDGPLAEVLGGVLFLHEELTEQERQRNQAMEELATALAQVRRQHEDLLRSRALTAELSTPLMRAGNGVIMLPLIGEIDEERASLILSRVLDTVKAERARSVILDITAVGTINNRSAQFLLRLVTATRLLGARVVLAGATPAVAQAIVDLDIDFSTLVSVRDLAEALRHVSSR